MGSSPTAPTVDIALRTEALQTCLARWLHPVS
jgi:hypothetical protein